MAELKKMLIESVEVSCKMRWLKMIDKQIKKRDKHYKQYKRYDYVAKYLMDEYKKRYENVNLQKKDGNEAELNDGNSK